MKALFAQPYGYTCPSNDAIDLMYFKQHALRMDGCLSTQLLSFVAAGVGEAK